MIATCWTLCIRFPLPIRFRTRPFFDGVKLCTTPYYKVLLRTAKYYSVLQTTNSVLHGTSKYYSVLQSTTPSLFRTTKYNKEILSTAKCYPALRSPFDSRNTWTVRFIAGSNLSDAKHNGTTTFMLDSRSNTCNIMYIARSNQNHPPTSPNIAPAMTNGIPRYQTRFGKRLNRHLHPAEQQESPSNFTKHCACHEKWRSKISDSIWQTAELSFTSCGASGITFNITKHCACHETGHATISEKM